MRAIPRQAIGGAAQMLHRALNQSAHDPVTQPSPTAHNQRMTLALVAVTCFLLGSAWAKARAQSF